MLPHAEDAAAPDIAALSPAFTEDAPFSYALSFDASGEDAAYAQTYMLLDGYIAERKKDQDNLPIILTLNSEGILRRDAQSLALQLGRLRASYDGVY